MDDPENGRVSLSGTTLTYNSVATYSCDAGYDLMGDNTRTCLGTGNWSGEEPTCTSKLDSQTMVLFNNRYLIHSKERNSTGGSDDVSVYISVGVCGTMVVVITSTVSVICVTLCLKRRKSKAKNTYVMTLSDNIAYTGTSDSFKDKETDTTYDYVYAAEQNDSSIITSKNVAYEMTSVVLVSNNPSYGIMHH